MRTYEGVILERGVFAEPRDGQIHDSKSSRGRVLSEESKEILRTEVILYQMHTCVASTYEKNLYVPDYGVYALYSGVKNYRFKSSASSITSKST